MTDRSSSTFRRPKLWLATDAEGAPGVFFAGKAGPVPLAVASLGEGVLEALSSRPIRSRPRHDPQGHFEPGRSPAERHVTATWQGSLGETVMALRRSTAEVEAALELGQAERLESESGVVLRFASLSSELARSLHRERACLRCYWPRRAPFDAEALAAAGFFPYLHLCEAWVPGPYGRSWLPSEPLHVDELPSELRALFAAVRFDVPFAKAPRLQPAERQPCHLGDEHYLDAEGEIRLPVDDGA